MNIGLFFLAGISSIHLFLINDIHVSVGTFHKNPYLVTGGVINVASKVDSLCVWVKFSFVLPQTRIWAEIEDTHGCLFYANSSTLKKVDNSPFLFENFPSGTQIKTFRLRMRTASGKRSYIDQEVTEFINRPAASIDAARIEHTLNCSFLRFTNDLSSLKPMPAKVQVYFLRNANEPFKVMDMDGNPVHARFTDIFGNSSFDGKNLCHYFPMKVELMDSRRKRTLEAYRIRGTQSE